MQHWEDYLSIVGRPVVVDPLAGLVVGRGSPCRVGGIVERRASPLSSALCRFSFASLQEWFAWKGSPIEGVGFQPIACRYGHEHCAHPTYGTFKAYDGWLCVYRALGNYIVVRQSEIT